MNWEFKASTSVDTQALIRDAASQMADGIEVWLLSHIEPVEKQEESYIHEFPEGFFHQGPSYRFRFRMYFMGQPIGPAEYDILVQQTFYPSESAMKKFTDRPPFKIIRSEVK